MPIHEIIARLVHRLGVVGSLAMGARSDPAYKQVVAALLGKASTTVVVVDALYRTRWIVLGSVTTEVLPQYPLVIKSDFLTERVCGPADARVLSRLQQLGWEGRADQLSTEEVAGWFRSRCNGIGADTAEFPSAWAAGGDESLARVTISGDIGECVAVTPDGEWESNSYHWYDLTTVPVGGSVWRISGLDTLWVFTHREEGRWEVTIVPDVGWARTSAHDGSRNFGTLIDGAWTAWQVLQAV